MPDLRILVPSAGERPAGQNADYIAFLASEFAAEVVVLQVTAPGSGERSKRVVEEAFQAACDRAGVPARCVRAELNAPQGGSSDSHIGLVQAIVMAALEHECKLIVMGASPGQAMARWLSSDVARATIVPVLIIPDLGGRNLQDEPSR